MFQALSIFILYIGDPLDAKTMVHCEIKHRKCACSSKTQLMNTLSMYRSYSLIPKSKSMHIMPRRHIETDPSTSSYFVTLSLEYPKAPSYSVVRSLIGHFVFRCKLVSSSVVRSLCLFVIRSNRASKVYQHR